MEQGPKLQAVTYAKILQLGSRRRRVPTTWNRDPSVPQGPICSKTWQSSSCLYGCLEHQDWSYGTKLARRIADPSRFELTDLAWTSNLRWTCSLLPYRSVTVLVTGIPSPPVLFWPTMAHFPADKRKVGARQGTQESLSCARKAP